MGEERIAFCARVANASRKPVLVHPATAEQIVVIKRPFEAKGFYSLAQRGCRVLSSA
jgi:hypothetical protein